MNQQEAELIGIHTGDGSLYKTTWSKVWEVRGALNENDYYDNHIVPLLQNIFNSEFKAKFRSGGAHGCYGIQTGKSAVTNFFIEKGFKVGSKILTGRIPESIVKSSNNCKLAFLRGLFDTDGCIRFDRANKQKLHTYPRIEFCFASELLRDDLETLVSSLGYRCYTWGKKYFKLCISGKEQAKKWFSDVKPTNKKHLNRFGFWLKRGYIIMPRSHSLAIAVIRKAVLTNRKIARSLRSLRNLQWPTRIHCPKGHGSSNRLTGVRSQRKRIAFPGAQNLLGSDISTPESLKVSPAA